jgi:hypothetical protein
LAAGKKYCNVKVGKGAFYEKQEQVLLDYSSLSDDSIIFRRLRLLLG